MFFWLKKLIAYWLMPVPMCVVLLGGGAILLRTRRAKLGRGLMLAGTVLLLLYGNKFVSAALVRPLEFTYPAIPEITAGTPAPAELAVCQYIVVLGAGHGFTPGRSATARLSPSALARLTEGVRLAQAVPGAKLLFTGPASGKQASHASVMGEAAVALGIDPTRIVLIEEVRDTEDESLAVKEKIGAVPFALVTSSWHMRRSVALFRHAGLAPLPCPTDFTAHDDGEWHWRDLVWDVESLERSTWAVRERIGLLWITLRGKN